MVAGCGAPAAVVATVGKASKGAAFGSRATFGAGVTTIAARLRPVPRVSASRTPALIAATTVPRSRTKRGADRRRGAAGRRVWFNANSRERPRPSGEAGGKHTGRIIAHWFSKTSVNSDGNHLAQLLVATQATQDVALDVVDIVDAAEQVATFRVNGPWRQAQHK